MHPGFWVIVTAIVGARPSGVSRRREEREDGSSRYETSERYSSQSTLETSTSNAGCREEPALTGE